MDETVKVRILNIGATFQQHSLFNTKRLSYVCRPRLSPWTKKKHKTANVADINQRKMWPFVTTVIVGITVTVGVRVDVTAPTPTVVVN